MSCGRWLQGTLLHQAAGLTRADHLRALESLMHAHETNSQWIWVGWELVLCRLTRRSRPLLPQLDLSPQRLIAAIFGRRLEVNGGSETSMDVSGG
jgi:hypothetical protein